MNDKKSRFNYLAVGFFFSFTVFFFFPMETFVANILEFEFPIKHVIWILLFTAVGVGMLFTGITYLVYKWKKSFGDICISLVFVFSLCYYIQGLLLNNHVVSVSGELIWFDRNVKIFNLLIWLGIIFASFLLRWICKQPGRILRLFASACVLIQTVGFISLLFTAPKSEPYKNYYITSEGEFELSEHNNVVVFVLDTCDNIFVEAAWKKYPDLFEPFAGFVYYPNAITTYSRTYPSIPYLLTGQKCFFDLPPTEYIENAWENSTFLENIKATGADIRVYTHPLYISGDTAVDNYIYYDGDSFSAISPFRLIKMMLKISAYKGMPYYLKPRYYYYPGEVNQYVMNHPADGSGFFDDRDDLFYESMKQRGVSINSEYSSAFRFYHLWGTHPGHHLNENGQMVEDDLPVEDTLKGDFQIINTYIQYLKQCGIYEKTTILIMSDHGSSYSSDDLLLHRPITALFMLKPKENSAQEEFSVNEAPISHENWFATVMQCFQKDNNAFGTPVNSIRSNDNTDRHYYHTALFSDTDGEIALREYTVSGDARVFDHWILSGRYWDIQYSENAVSKTRLSDFLSGQDLYSINKGNKEFVKQE